MARRIGRAWELEGLLEDREDVFYLTIDELLGDRPDDVRATIAFRKARRMEYLRFELGERWHGHPEPIPMDLDQISNGQTGLRAVKGIGVSPGVVEGRALVVTDPAEPGAISTDDILICHTTDPSWASLFFLVSACVIDVGGPMSHGAIVARELGVPCVINTRDGTRQLQTGDLLRVDGTAGTVEVLRHTDPSSGGRNAKGGFDRDARSGGRSFSSSQ